MGTLTAIPVPPPRRVDSSVAGLAMLLAPVVGLLPAAMAGALCLACGALGVPPLLVGVAVVASLALLTRGLHLDGLADTADGLASGYDRERALTVMRRGDVGPSGATTLTLVLLGQVAAVAALTQPQRPALALLVGLAVVVSRTMLALACVRGIAAARPDGLGAGVIGTVGRAPAAGALLAATALLAVAASSARLPWWGGALAMVLAATAVAALLARCVRRLGGVTGDVLGAAVESSLLVTLTVLATAAAAATNGI